MPRAREYLIRTDKSLETTQDFSHDIKEALATSTGTAAEIRRVEMVGPQVGEDLREKALFAMFYALLFIAIYISGRFELKWMLSGVMAASTGRGRVRDGPFPCEHTVFDACSARGHPDIILGSRIEICHGRHRRPDS